MEITHTLPKYQTRNSRWHPKFNSYNCNMSFVENQRTQSLTHPTTHAAITTFSTSHNSISSQYSPRVLQHQRQTQYSMLQIKTLSLNTFRPSASYLLHHPPFISHNLARGITTLSGETTQRKHTYVTPSSSLNTNKLPSRQQQKLWLKSSYNFIYNKSIQETRRTRLSRLILHKETSRTNPKNWIQN